MRERSGNICAEIYLQFVTLQINFKQMKKIIAKYGPIIVVVVAVISLAINFQQLRLQKKNSKPCNCNDIDPL